MFAKLHNESFANFFGHAKFDGICWFASTLLIMISFWIDPGFEGGGGEAPSQSDARSPGHAKVS